MNAFIVKKGCLMLILLLPSMVFGDETLQDIEADTIEVIRISAMDGTAVIRDARQRLRIMRIGDFIGATGKVVEITEGRVVIEEKTDKGIEIVIIRIVDERQNIERIRGIGEGRPQLYAPQSTKGTKGHEERK